MCKELLRTKLACPLICKGCHPFLTLPAALGDALFRAALVQLLHWLYLYQATTKNTVLVLSWVGVGIFFFSTKVLQRSKSCMILRVVEALCGFSAILECGSW